MEVVHICIKVDLVSVDRGSKIATGCLFEKTALLSLLLVLLELLYLLLMLKVLLKLILLFEDPCHFSLPLFVANLALFQLLLVGGELLGKLYFDLL